MNIADTAGIKILQFLKQEWSWIDNPGCKDYKEQSIN